MHSSLVAANSPDLGAHASAGNVVPLPRLRQAVRKGNAQTGQERAGSTRWALLLSLESDAVYYACHGEPLLSRKAREDARQVRAAIMKQAIAEAAASDGGAA